MTALRRTQVGNYKVQDAYTVPVLTNMERASAESLLLPLDSVFSDYSSVILSPGDEAHCRNGRPFSLDLPDGTYRLYDANKQFLMLAAVESESVHALKRFY